MLKVAVNLTARASKKIAEAVAFLMEFSIVASYLQLN
jgi:hypothetical protein